MAGHRSALWIPIAKSNKADDQLVEEKLQILAEKVAERIGNKYSCKVNPNDIETSIHINALQKDRNDPGSVVPIALVIQYRGCSEKRRLQYNAFDNFFQQHNPVNYTKPTYYSMPNHGHAYAFMNADDITDFSKYFDVHFDTNDLKSEEGFSFKW